MLRGPGDGISTQGIQFFPLSPDAGPGIRGGFRCLLARPLTVSRSADLDGAALNGQEIEGGVNGEQGEEKSHQKDIEHGQHADHCRKEPQAESLIVVTAQPQQFPAQAPSVP